MAINIRGLKSENNKGHGVSLPSDSNAKIEGRVSGNKKGDIEFRKADFDKVRDKLTDEEKEQFTALALSPAETHESWDEFVGFMKKMINKYKDNAV